jgi:hypothetical protein
VGFQRKYETTPGSTVVVAVMDPAQQNLVSLLFREVIPAMLRLELDPRV